MWRRQLQLRWITLSLGKPYQNRSLKKWSEKFNFPKQRAPGDKEIARELGTVLQQFSFAQY